MQLATAKKVFASLMQKAREGKNLSQLESRTLSRARQTIRQHAKPAMNAAPGSWDFVKTVAERYGLHVSRNRPGDGKTRYSFYKVDAQGRETKHLYTAVGIRDAMTYVNAFRDGKENPHVRFFPSRTKAETHAKKLRKKGVYSDVHYEPVGSMYRLTTPTKKELKEHAAKMRKLSKRPGTLNPPMRGAVKIYGRCLRIEAVKMVSHLYGGKKTPATQKYFHDFTTKNAMIYGLPDGSLLIKAR
jgi:hypothetical protein